MSADQIHWLMSWKIAQLDFPPCVRANAGARWCQLPLNSSIKRTPWARGFATVPGSRLA